MHRKSVFDELELVIEMTLAPTPCMDENQITIKKYDMPSMQRFELSTKIWSSYHLRAPLDSTANYPIPQSPTNDTGKIETLSRSYLWLEQSSWARWCQCWSHQDGSPFLIVTCTCSMETPPNTPPYTIMGEPCLAPSSRIHCKLQANDIFRYGLSWTCTTWSSRCVDQTWLHSLHNGLINFAISSLYSSFNLDANKWWSSIAYGKVLQ